MRSLGLLLLALCGATASLQRADPLDSVLSSVDAQLERQINPDGTVNVQSPLERDADHLFSRFKSSANDVVSALNSLDLKTLAFRSKAPEPKQHPRNAVAAFAQIGLETIYRAQYALSALKEHRKALENHARVEKHNLVAWLKNQKQTAEAQIATEEQRLARLTDEISHLQHVHQDAVAKEQSYATQSNQLQSERQLQRTPPLIPAVVAGALSDRQYDEAIAKLAQYRTLALQVIDQSRKGIELREHIIAEGTIWVKRSKQQLLDWEATQSKVIQQREALNQKALDINAQRIEAVGRILEEAKTQRKHYVAAVNRMDLESNIKVIEENIAHYSKVKATDPYEEARIKEYTQGLQLHLKHMQEQLKKIPGTAEVSEPPATWGVLAGFPYDLSHHYVGEYGRPYTHIPGVGSVIQDPEVNRYMNLPTVVANVENGNNAAAAEKAAEKKEEKAEEAQEASAEKAEQQQEQQQNLLTHSVTQMVPTYSESYGEGLYSPFMSPDVEYSTRPSVFGNPMLVEERSSVAAKQRRQRQRYAGGVAPPPLPDLPAVPDASLVPLGA